MLFVNEKQFRDQQGIFPIIVFERNTRLFRCIGTASFINGNGFFITAKHIFEDELQADSLIYVVQGLPDSGVCARPIKDLSIHQNADIAVGFCGRGLNPLTARETTTPFAPHGRLSFKTLQNGTELLSAGYPKGEFTINGSLQTFNLKCNWNAGIVTNLHLNGFSLLRNKCYQTNFHIPSGCSGGPIYDNGLLVGINSSSFDFEPGEKPISFFTPVELALPLKLPFRGSYLSVLELIKQRQILVA